MPIFEGRAEVVIYVEAADEVEADDLILDNYRKVASNLSSWDFEVCRVKPGGYIDGGWGKSSEPFTNSDERRTIAAILDAEAEADKARAIFDAHPKLPLTDDAGGLR